VLESRLLTSLNPLEIWKAAPPELVLLKNELHVWQYNLFQSDTNSLFETLSSDEKQRARRFYFDRDRIAYVSCRGMLRTLVGKYVQADPASLSFDYTSYGKPLLPSGSTGAKSGLVFNISHSNALALFAFAIGRDVGVDVEFVRPGVAKELIAERFFSTRETEKLRSLPAGEQAAAFFRCWTRKEAFIKARGDGLSLPLDQFDVTLGPGEPAALIRTDFDPSQVHRWTFYDLNLNSDYAGAVALEGKVTALKLYRLNER
jgi:4'-phosphopantetheinyl transferase